MSDGYTPVFSTVFDGSLYGKWPESPVWLTMLALCDKRGNVDMSYEAIAGRTGWPMDLLRQGIAALMQPDPASRSPSQDGRRLVPLTEGRGWGWHVVNHALYREKARLMAKNEREVASGANGARLADRRRPPETADNEAIPPPTAADPLSDTNTNTSSERAPRKRGADGTRVPDPFPITAELREWAKGAVPGLDVDKATAEFLDYWRGVPGAKGRKLDWEGTWRNRLRELHERRRPTPKKQPERSEWM